MSGTWVSLAGPSTGTPTVRLTRARGRKFSFRVAEPDTYSFDIDGRHPESLDLLELATDVHGVRDGVPLFTGRLGATGDSMDADGHRTKVSVVDTRGLLGRRITSADRTWTGADVADVARTLLLDAMTDPLSRDPNPANLNVTVPTWAATGVTVSRTSKAGEYILDELQALGGGQQGKSTVFDWDISPGWTGRTAQLWTPARGRDLTASVVLTYLYNAKNPVSSNVASLNRSVDPKDYANQVRVTGGVKTVKQTVVTTTPGSGAAAGTSTTTTTPAASTSSTATGSVTTISRGARAVRAAGTVERGTRTLLPAVSNEMTPIPPAIVPAVEVVTEVEVKIPTTPVSLGDGRSAWDIGIYAKSEAYTDIIEQTELQTKAAQRLAELELFAPSYSVKLKRGFWEGPDHIWKGDIVRVLVASGRIVEDRALRVTGIDVTPGDDGGEDVSLIVGSTTTTPLDDIRDAQRALAELARSSLR